MGAEFCQAMARFGFCGGRKAAAGCDAVFFACASLLEREVGSGKISIVTGGATSYGGKSEVRALIIFLFSRT